MDQPRRARGEGEELRPFRRDPRAEPESDRPGSEKTLHGLAPSPTIPTPAPGNEAPGVALLCKQVASLQLQLAAAEAELHGTGEPGIDGAERVLRVQSLRDDLARERAVVEELSVSLEEKLDECKALQKGLADAHADIAKRKEKAAEHVAQRERAARDLAELRTALDASSAREEAAKAELLARTAELATLSTQHAELAAAHSGLTTLLDELRPTLEANEAELEKASHAVKSANMKAFTASKQLESWKSESLRMMDQARTEHGAFVAELKTAHEGAIVALRREASDATAASAALQRKLEVAAVAVGAAAASLEAAREAVGRVGTQPAGSVGSPAPIVGHAAQAPAAIALQGAPTQPAMPASLKAKSPPPEPPPVEMAELDLRAEDLFAELTAKPPVG